MDRVRTYGKSVVPGNCRGCEDFPGVDGVRAMRKLRENALSCTVVMEAVIEY